MDARATSQDVGDRQGGKVMLLGRSGNAGDEAVVPTFCCRMINLDGSGDCICLSKGCATLPPPLKSVVDEGTVLLVANVLVTVVVIFI